MLNRRVKRVLLALGMSLAIVSLQYAEEAAGDRV